MLSLKGVSSGYGRIAVLHDIHMDVRQGEIVTLIGANGAGKTTLLFTLCGQPQTKAGSIQFDGHELTHMPTHHIVRKGIALVPEGRRIFSRLTVTENLQMGALVTDSAFYRQDLEKVFTLFPRLKERADQRAGTLSGGEQQMLAIGRALMSRPRLLLLDEPSLGLAPMVVKQIFATLRDLNAGGMTVFVVEQNAFQALTLAHRAYVLVNGRITLEGEAKSLLTNPDVQAAYLGGLAS